MKLVRAFLAVVCIAAMGIVPGGCGDDIISIDGSSIFQIDYFVDDYAYGQTWYEHYFYITPSLLRGNYKVHWDFGDGETQDVMRSYSARHTYTKTGNYTVTATVYDEDGSVTTRPSRGIEIRTDGKQLRFMQDTLTVSVDENITLRAVCYTPPTTKNRVYFNWGDSKETCDGIYVDDTISASHTYTTPGIYRAIIRRGGVPADPNDPKDTMYIAVKEYLRPCNADKITITVTGSVFLFGDTLHPEGGAPSAQTFELTQIEYIVAGGGKPLYEIHWHQSQRLDVKTSGFGVVTSYNGFVKLNSEGTRIEDLDFDAFGMRSTSDSSIKVNQHFVLYQVPLASGIAPRPDYAVYELTGSNISTVKNRFLHRVVTRYSKPARDIHILDLLQWLPTPESRIRVVFSKE